MTRAAPLLMLFIILFAAAPTTAQDAKRDPRIGYLYPAGAQRGTTVRVLVGGQFLRSSESVYVSGEGISGKVVEHYPPLRNIDKEQRDVLLRRMADCAQVRWDELVEMGLAKGKPPWNLTRKPSMNSEDVKPVELPKHFLLNDWEQMSLRQLAYIRDRLTDRSMQQLNAQIAETVLVELTIDADAVPGDRELRLRGGMGLTNPMLFQIGQLPEVQEVESNDPREWDPLPLEPPVNLPVVINGQVLPGDVDRLRFNAEAGQTLVIKVQARHLVPFLADAVPGWFQPVVTVYDTNGRELAFADDYYFDPDPVIHLDVPENGVYTLEIRDAIYRGREDFIYRISIGELPFITSMYPLVGSNNESTSTAIKGWNLPTEVLSLPSQPAGVYTVSLDHPLGPSNPMMYLVDDAPVQQEVEPDNPTNAAQKCELPLFIEGRINSPGDVDIYRFEGQAGQHLVAEVIARRLHSPLDSLLRVTDSQGKTIAWNDDFTDRRGYLHRGYGVLTHQADSRLEVELPENGIYEVSVTDATCHGGPAYGYQLRIGPPKPDFELYIGPSSVNVITGHSTPLTVHVLRRDGFDGSIELQLVEPPAGFTLDEATVPAGVDCIRVTLTAPTERIIKPFELNIQGQAVIEGSTITKRATPVDDVMQAFLWRHLVPTRQMLVSNNGRRRSPTPPKRIGDTRIQVPAGGSASVSFRAELPRDPNNIHLDLNEPPDGLSIGPVRINNDQISFDLIATNEVNVGLTDNLIIDLSMHFTRNEKDRTQRSIQLPLGSLPAVPFVIVERPLNESDQHN